jgi:hypothetical protein
MASVLVTGSVAPKPQSQVAPEMERADKPASLCPAHLWYLSPSSSLPLVCLFFIAPDLLFYIFLCSLSEAKDFVLFMTLLV